MRAQWRELFPRCAIGKRENQAVLCRRPDPSAQMRNMVRAITEKEIDEVATFYARKAAAAEGK